jgi:hypothetical protein
MPTFRSTTRSRRHRNSHTPEETQQQQPFFSKTKDTPMEQKERPFFSGKPAPVVQPTLAIGQPGDQYEREADSVADKVFNRTGQVPAVQQKPGISAIQRLATPKEEEKLGTNDARIERDRETQKVDPNVISRKEEEKPVQKMTAKEEEKPVQKMHAAPDQEDKKVQTKAAGTPAPTANLSARLDNTRGKGNPLPVKTRADMEAAIGADFRGVRIHTDRESAELNRALGAHAFTTGIDVYFNQGKFNPETADGKRLLAHELTHVVQQNGDVVTGKRLSNHAKPVSRNMQAHYLQRRCFSSPGITQVPIIYGLNAGAQWRVISEATAASANYTHRKVVCESLSHRLHLPYVSIE